MIENKLKIINKKIIFGIAGIILISASILFWNKEDASAQTAGPCKAVSANFIPQGTQGSGFYSDSAHPPVTVDIKTTGCAGKKISMSIVSKDRPILNADEAIVGFNEIEFTVPPDGNLKIFTKAGEDNCWVGADPDCSYYIELHKTSVGLTAEYSTENIANGYLAYDCEWGCSAEWEFLGTSLTPTSNLGACKAKLARFIPSGYQMDGWYKDDAHPKINIEIKTENCAGKKVEMSVVERDTADPNDDIVGFDNATFPVASTNSLMIYTKVGEAECDDTSDPDCQYYIQLYKSDGGLTEDYDSLNSPGNPEGQLSYNCQGNLGCDDFNDDWEYEAIGGRSVAKWFFLSTSTVKQGPFNTKEECLATWATFTKPFGKCTLEVIIGTAEDFEDPVVVTSTNTGQFDNAGYDLLAPLPGLTRVDNTTTFGDYLNIILKLAIGLAGALAVFMIVVGGVQYMTSEAFGAKEAGKKRIMNAIGGLLLALGSYMLLNTINPNLVNLKLNVQQVSATIVSEVSDDGSTAVTIEYAPTAGECPTDCVNFGPEVPNKSSSGRQVVKDLKTHLVSLVSKLSATAVGGKWGVTEAWAPSRVHKAHCHKIGTCIDANFTYSPQASDVKAFIDSAKASGLCAIYEVKSATARQAFIDGGVDPKQILNLGTWISAPHFSVYGGNCK